MHDLADSLEQRIVELTAKLQAAEDEIERLKQQEIQTNLSHGNNLRWRQLAEKDLQSARAEVDQLRVELHEMRGEK